MNETSPASSDPTRKKPSPLEYRIAIADYCGNEQFRNTVLESGSNNNSAIYFRKSQLVDIASTLQLPHEENHTNSELRLYIRTHISSHHLKQPQSQTKTPQTESKQNSNRIVPDGGSNTVQDVPSDSNRFSYRELIQLANTLGVTPDPPYSETKLRKLAGSSIAGPYLAELIEKSYVDLYVSGNVGRPTAENGTRAYYPFRLQPVHDISDEQVDRPNCHQFMVDSSVDKPSFGNIDALNAAHRVNADTVVLADKYKDMHGTVEAVCDGLELYREHEFDGEVIIPLQAPHDKCYRLLQDRGVDSDHTFAIGGLKDCKIDRKKIAAAKSVQQEAKEQIDIHGLGFGVTDTIAHSIRSNPGLLSSIDYSTPIQSNIGDAKPGEERLSTVAAKAGATLIEDIRKVSSLVDDTATETSTLGDF